MARPTKYKFELLQINASKLVPFVWHPKHFYTLNSRAIQQAVWHCQRRTGYRFRIQGTPRGLIVTRIA